MLDLLTRHRPTAPQDGQTMAEYGIILVLVSIVAVGVLMALGAAIVPSYSNAAAAF